MRLRTKILLAGSVLVLAGLYWSWNEDTKAAVAEALERCRAAGLPVAVDDLRSPPIPDADNAALVFAKFEPLFEALPAPAGSGFFDIGLTRFEQAHPALRLDEAGTRELAALLNNPPVGDLMDLIAEAAAKPSYDARIELEKGPAAQVFPLLESLQSAAKLLLGHAQLSASEGRDDEACTDIWHMTVLAEFLKDEPLDISQSIRAGIWSMAVEGMEKMAGTGSMSATWNQKFAGGLERLDLTKGFALSLDGERVTHGQFTFGQLLEGKKPFSYFFGKPDFTDTQQLFNWLKAQRYRISGVIRLEEADYIDTMVEVRTLIGRPSSNYQALEQELKDGMAPGRLIMNNTLRTYGGEARTCWWTRAQIISAEVGLALERYREAKGDYPPTLAALEPDFLPKVPLDIFTNKPLIYRTEPGGAVVYSVGPNLRDDGGVDDEATDKDDPSWFAGAAILRKYAPPPGPTSP